MSENAACQQFFDNICVSECSGKIMRALLPQKYHSYIYIGALVLLVVGLPLSKFLLSLSQIILIVNWLIEGDLKSKFRSFIHNKPALVLSSLLFLHFIGLLYTSDFGFAWNDIRVKIPLFILPLILSTSQPLSLPQKHIVLNFFVAAVTFNTIIGTLILTDIIHRHIADVRYASIFISHVRLALLICIAIFISAGLYVHPLHRKWRMLHAAIILWLLFFLVLSESITGVSALLVSLLLYLLYRLFRTGRTVLKYIVLAVLISSITFAGYFIYSTYQRYATIDRIDISKLDKYTAQGNPYKHESLANPVTENGHYVWIYYCDEELKEEWNKRSRFDYNWKNMRGDVIRHTLIRFLTSKNLRKDAEGVRQLSNEEIRAIEKGIANVDYMSGIKGRISEIIWEIQLYNKTGDANGHSITQRFEYWKAAAGIIKQNPVIGVGTGDLQTAFTQQYEKNGTTLDPAWRLRSHNQYLSITAAFGVLGLIWFLFTLMYPAIKRKAFSDFFYFSFFIVALMSFLTEDTLETQVGVTFYAFFNAFFLFLPESPKYTSPEKNS
jgi:hypothetical protein